MDTDLWRINYLHGKCRMESTVYCIETPPKVMICPGCHEVLKLAYVNGDTGATYYDNCGKHERKWL